MSDHEWHDITSYNLIIPQKSMIELYNIKFISHHFIYPDLYVYTLNNKEVSTYINGDEE